MSAQPESYISPEQYLADEKNRPDGEKYEYVNGQIYAMAGASRNHNRTTGILFARLFNHLENTACEVFLVLNLRKNTGIRRFLSASSGLRPRPQGNHKRSLVHVDTARKSPASGLSLPRSTAINK